jgi:flagellar biosynthesis protein FlhF
MLKQLVNQKEKSGEFSPKRDTKNKLRQRLIQNDIPEDVVEDIYNRIREENKDRKITSRTYEKEIRNTIENIINVSGKPDGRVHVLIGPTGVGKTTTIAKLASLYKLYNNKKVGLITLDTYRIGAVEQLKTYAEILGVPFEVILSIKDIPQVIAKMKDCEIVLVDTTGRNSKNIMQVSETGKYIEKLKADRVHLVLSMTTKQNDIKKIISNFKPLNYNSLILTKVDETDLYGSIFASLYYGSIPVSYITTGQNVPEDIEEASKDRLIKLVMGAEN